MQICDVVFPALEAVVDIPRRARQAVTPMVEVGTVRVWKRSQSPFHRNVCEETFRPIRSLGSKN